MLAAESTANTLGVNVNFLRIHSEEVHELGLGLERRLRTRAHVHAPVLALVGDSLVRLEMRVLNLVSEVGAIDDYVRFRETFFDVAVFALDLDEDILARALNTRVCMLVVQHRRARLHRLLGIENRGENFVIDFDEPAGRFGDAFGVGDNGSHSLADKTRDLVQNERVVGIDAVIVVQGGRVTTLWHVLPCEDGMNTR